MIVSSEGRDSKGFPIAPTAQAIGIAGLYKLDPSPITAQNAARSGETNLADLTGAGLTDVAVATGAPAPASLFQRQTQT